MFDTFTNTVTDAGKFDARYNAHSDGIDRGDYMGEAMDISHMVRCPRGCGVRFHGEYDAFKRHVAYADTHGECENLWG